MPRFERDSSKRQDPQVDVLPSSQRPSSAAPGSNADAEDAAANIAELVRRTAEREARPGPSSIARPNAAVRQPQPTPARPVAQQVAPRVARLDTPPTRLALGQPSRRVLAAVGAAAAVLIAGGLTLASQMGPDAAQKATANPTAATAPIAPIAPIAGSSAPTGYAVKVTDVISDCASHARGQTKTSFEKQNCVKATRSLATGQVRGRPALFVVARIQMASDEAAAMVKQVLDGSGTGNLNDLLRDGKTFPGAPDKMPSSGYTSVQSGKVVTVAEAGFVDDGQSSSSDPALRAAAAQVATLVSSQS